MKRILSLVTLAAMLALPSGAFAATSAGATTEDLTGPPVTITATFPATTTYTRGTDYAATIAISNLTTNNPTGMRVDMTTSAFTGAATVPTTVRSRDLQTEPTGWGGAASARAVGYYATSATTDWLANRSTATTGPGSFSITMHAQLSAFTVINGVYAGTLSFTASTNP